MKTALTSSILVLSASLAFADSISFPPQYPWSQRSDGTLVLDVGKVTVVVNPNGAAAIISPHYVLDLKAGDVSAVGCRQEDRQGKNRVCYNIPEKAEAPKKEKK